MRSCRRNLRYARCASCVLTFEVKRRVLAHRHGYEIDPLPSSGGLILVHAHLETVRLEYIQILRRNDLVARCELQCARSRQAGR
jgi:hypothetical protein